MKKIWVRVPVRADLAGGTLDLWPLYLFHPGSRTVNVAISLFADCDIEAAEPGVIELHLTDAGYERRYANAAELSADPKAALIARAVEHFRISGIRITTRTDAPRGSGLGGSSALAVALVRGLSEFADEPVEGEELIALVRDLETRLLDVPAGIQDYYPPVYGGLGSLHLHPGRVARHPIGYPLPDLAKHLVLHYTGVSHFSGTNNWEIYKRQIDGDKRVRDGLARINESAQEMEKALESLDSEGAGKALAKEWANRKSLIDGVSNAEIDRAIELAAAAGAWGGKACGAGGGGCIVFLAPRDKRDAVIEALTHAPGRTLNVVPVQAGLTMERTDDTQGTLISLSKRSRGSHSPVSLEQLYMTTRSKGFYKPFYLAQAQIVFDEPRAGTRSSVSRSYVAPINWQREQIEWSEARVIDPAILTLNAVPDSGRTMSVPTDSTALTTATTDGEEGFRQYLLESERLILLYNQTFNLYSDPEEPRETFINRCMEAANRQLTDEAERLESTFRRRIDQLRERSEREQRVAEDEGHEDIGNPDLGIAWGQTLYNITSGKASSTKVPESATEADYMEHIALIQKTWDRELEIMRDDLFAKARAVEEVSLIPASRNIDITRVLLIWAPRI